MHFNRVLRLIYILLLYSATFIQASATDNGSIPKTLRSLVNSAASFAERMPREKVYVHLDNTGYFKGDKILFQCYVVDGTGNVPTRLSHTLYVELLNPRGVVISRQILKIDNGRCHGSFTLDHLPFYSGFYEIRALTKYMLNFGDAAVFSRAIPIFDAPKKAGDFSEWKMARHISKYPGNRPRTKSGSDVSMRFFPEGGRLIADVPVKVAFETTGHNGSPIEVSGRVVDESTGQTVASIQSLHEGRGVFELTPRASVNYSAVVSCGSDHKELRFKLPQISASGIGLSVDNLSLTDSIMITIHPANGTGMHEIGGLAISSQGALSSYTFVDLTKELTLRLSSRDIPSGVSIISLFGSDGHTIAERMIFVNNGGYGTLTTSFGEIAYEPNEKVTLDLMATDTNGMPASHLPLSVSVIDGDNAVDYAGALLSDLLLMSEVKGYIRNPMQYFRDDSPTSRRNLDLLMMVLGWRCYSWEDMSGLNPHSLRYYPEQAIDIEGQIVSFVRGIPKAGVDLSLMVSGKEADDSLRQTFTGMVTTDSCGRFSLSYDFTGKWNMVMSVSENGKKKDHRVILDRLFSPAPRKYEPAEMSFDPIGKHTSAPSQPIIDPDTIAENEELYATYDPKTVNLHEVVVKGKRNREADIYKARSKSLVYYDLQEELADLADDGKVVGNDLFDVLKNINPNFQRAYNKNQEKLYYKTKKPLFVINYATTYKRDSLNYTLLYPENIKSIFISEDPGIILKFADPEFTLFSLPYSCAVFIETFSEPKGPTSKGTRRQTVEGYTIPEEFLNIDDSALLDNPDFRRTLYWNPMLTTGPDGKARVEFLNNSTCRNFQVSIHGISNDGTIYSY